MNDKILTQIKSLPPLPDSVIKIQEITSNPDSGVKDLVPIIEKDPMLKADLLKAANSPLYGFTKQIKTVDRAVALFGMTTVKGFVISFAIRNTLKFDLSAYGISEDQFQDVALKRNALAFNWYRLNKQKLDIIATDAFLIDIGAVIISLILITENRHNEFRNKLTPQNRYALEKEYVGATTPEITAELFKRWHFGQDLIIPIQYIDNPENAPEYNECAASLDVLRTTYDLLDPNNEENLNKAFEKIEKYNLDINQFKEALEKISN
ncbi:HDOD domain-containing protein [Caminibacter pacificus]|jgi:HD-like signal output (HDOD) protein